MPCVLLVLLQSIQPVGGAGLSLPLLRSYYKPYWVYSGCSGFLPQSKNKHVWDIWRLNCHLVKMQDCACLYVCVRNNGWKDGLDRRQQKPVTPIGGNVHHTLQSKTSTTT